MKIKLYYPAFDPGAAESLNVEDKFRYQGTYYTFDVPLLDGPISDRVALLDFDPVSGALAHGVRVLPPSGGQKLHQLELRRADFKASPKSVNSIQALCFGAVMRTIHLVEDKLGRQVDWAFDSSQLLVVPRAGYQANAFYHRASHSLQFFLVPSDDRPPNVSDNDGELSGIYTALSPDVVAHETAHALVDAVAPYLHDAASPESLALHEAISDLTALIFSLRTRNFVTYMLDRSGGDLEPASIGAIAEEIGKLSAGATSIAQEEAETSGARHYLRNLANRYALKPGNGMEMVPSMEPHDLSQVLSGALFDLLIDLFKETRERREQQSGLDAYSASGYAVASAVRKLSAVLYRALDYLPPGEISFADFGRAMLAADDVVFPDAAQADVRELLSQKLACRGISDIDGLFAYRHAAFPDVSKENLERLAEEENDWKVYDFVNRFSNLFRVPDNTPFQVHKSLVLRKPVKRPQAADEIRAEQAAAARHAAAEQEFADAGDLAGIEAEVDSDEALETGNDDGLVEREVRELLIKVSWKQRETLQFADGIARNFEFRYGTTVSFDLDRRKVLVRLTTNADAYPESCNMASQEPQRRARQALIGTWLDKGLLSEGVATSRDDSQPRLLAVDGVHEVRNMAHMLHVAHGGEYDLPVWMIGPVEAGGGA